MKQTEVLEVETILTINYLFELKTINRCTN